LTGPTDRKKYRTVTHGCGLLAFVAMVVQFEAVHHHVPRGGSNDEETLDAHDRPGSRATEVAGAGK